MKRFTMIAPLLLSFAMVAGVAHAEPSQSPVSAEAKKELLKRVDTGKAQAPVMFTRIAKLRDEMPKLDARKRGRYAVIAPSLNALGKDALVPMLDMLVLHEADDATMTEEVRVAWRVGLLEAVATQRDAFAATYAAAVLEGTEKDPSVQRAAALVLAQAPGDAWEQKLIGIALNKSDARRAPVVSALGARRTLRAADALGQVLAASMGDAELARTAVDSLGRLGSSWGFRALGIEGTDVRAACARALVPAYLKSRGELQADVLAALSMLESPESTRLLAAARPQADESTRKAIDLATARLAAK